jgi:ATP-dependent Clp protease ATP-binding subunit ClpB
MDNFAEMNDFNKAEVVEKTKNQVFDLMKQTIRPEFLNRIDEIIMFTPLSKEDVRQIVELQVGGVQKMMAENGITLNVDEAAMEFLSDEGYDPTFGARPVKRTLQKYLINELSKAILAGTVSRDSVITVSAQDKNLLFSNG